MLDQNTDLNVQRRYLDDVLFTHELVQNLDRVLAWFDLCYK
jgi:hypothetical protein